MRSAIRYVGLDVHKEKIVGAGERHFFIRPLDDEARRDVERQVFEALALEEEVARRIRETGWPRSALFPSREH